MMSKKSTKTVYWIFTILLLLPTAGSGIPELFMTESAPSVASIQLLGYPLYVLKILGLAKILGAVAILINKSPRLKEWAYAGFTFNFLGAIASHFLAGDYAHAPFPAVFLIFLGFSYFTQEKRFGT